VDELLILGLSVASLCLVRVVDLLLALLQITCIFGGVIDIIDNRLIVFVGLCLLGRHKGFLHEGHRAAEYYSSTYDQGQGSGSYDLKVEGLWYKGCIELKH
jgi:hypothetical protein